MPKRPVIEVVVDLAVRYVVGLAITAAITWVLFGTTIHAHPTGEPGRAHHEQLAHHRNG